jgi:hypothetical protein
MAISSPASRSARQQAERRRRRRAGGGSPGSPHTSLDKRWALIRRSTSCTGWVRQTSASSRSSTGRTRAARERRRGTGTRSRSRYAPKVDPTTAASGHLRCQGADGQSRGTTLRGYSPNVATSWFPCPGGGPVKRTGPPPHPGRAATSTGRRRDEGSPAQATPPRGASDRAARSPSVRLTANADHTHLVSVPPESNPGALRRDVSGDGRNRGRAFFPMDDPPDWLRGLADLFPIKHLAEALLPVRPVHKRSRIDPAASRRGQRLGDRSARGRGRDVPLDALWRVSRSRGASSRRLSAAAARDWCSCTGCSTRTPSIAPLALHTGSSRGRPR